MSSKTKIWAILGLVAAVAAIAIVVVCLSKTGEETPAKPASRLEDPVYAGKLAEVRTEQKDIFKAIQIAQTDLEKAVEEGADAEKLAALSNAVDAATAELVKIRAKARAIVRERILKDAAEANNNFKTTGK